jgi:GTP-binding protein
VKAELSRSAERPVEYPTDDLPEIAVLGRSNVGKSSFINALLGRKSLARTSGRPGKTRRIHFYRVDDALYLVDLPGFGYAAVSHDERRAWRPMAEAYLRGARSALVGAVLLVDVRRGPEQEERQLLEWLASEGIETLLVATKSDKLSRQKSRTRRDEWVQGTRGRVALVSARTGAGLADVAGWLRERTGFELRTPDGRLLAGDGGPQEEAKQS